MAAWKRHGGLEPHQVRLKEGMLKNGYTAEFAAQIFEQIKGFGSYGFPESHAASFALLTYASCWLKCHEPAAFACALINSWPMGFYSPDQILQDARRHHLQIRAVDVRASDWDCSLEPVHGEQPAIRMGLRMIRGFREDDARRIEAARLAGEFVDIADLGERAISTNSPAGSLPACRNSLDCSPVCRVRKNPGCPYPSRRWGKTCKPTTPASARPWARIRWPCYVTNSKPGAAAARGNYSRSSMGAMSASPGWSPAGKDPGPPAA